MELVNGHVLKWRYVVAANLDQRFDTSTEHETLVLGRTLLERIDFQADVTVCGGLRPTSAGPW